MRPSAASILALALLCAAATQVTAGSEPKPSGAAHVEKVFLIPASDGYGTGECLSGGASECGQVVANAWCESQGFASAASYGVAAADEYTGSIEQARAASERPIRITCQD